MGKVELLAPAGTMECFMAAMRAGADAVYIGGQKFGARAFAGNFTDEEVLQAIRIAHFWNRKVYLTVNTLLKENELKEVVPYLTPFYEAGLDAVIIQDPGVLKICREHFPDLALHASTQMTVTEAGAANLLKELGIERVVPARELSLEEIRILKEESGLEIETFIHGALCYAYSGQCLFSSFLGGRSGNRGRCAQPCRQPYRCTPDKNRSKEEKYPLSLKDLCILPLLPSLIRAGIDSFKIEGRMKSPEYVAGVTAIYRKYIDLYETDPDHWKTDKKDLELLSQLYVRSGLEQGYFERYNGKEMVTLDKPGYTGCSEAVVEQIRESIMQREMNRPVDLMMSLTADCPAFLSATTMLEDGTSIEVFGEGNVVSPAQKRPLTEADVTKQLKKTGGSSFEAQNIEVYLNGDVFMPMGAINDLRRQVLDKLYDAVCLHFSPETDRTVCNQPDVCVQEQSNPVTGLRVQALFAEQAEEAVKNHAVERLYLSADCMLSAAEDTTSLIRLIGDRKKSDPDFTFFLTLPSILRAYSENWLKKLNDVVSEYSGLIDGICVSSVSGIAAARRFGWKQKIALASNVYCWNKASLSEYEKMAEVVTYGAPVELNRSGLSDLPRAKMEMMVYGRIPMMISANCVRKTAGECRITHDAGILEKGIDRRLTDCYLTDRYKVDFPVLANCMHCMNTIYNSVPLSLHAYLDEIMTSGIQAVRLDFTTESKQEVREIIAFYAGGGDNPVSSHTTGHYKKGAQ